MLTHLLVLVIVSILSAPAKKSGVSHFTYDTEGECLMGVRKLLSYLPNNNEEKPPVIKSIKEKQSLLFAVNKMLNRVGNLGKTFLEKSDDQCAKLKDIVPDNSRHPYDVKEVIGCIVDNGSFFEVQKEFAQKTGIAESTISDWKKKKTNPVSDKILIICEVLGVTPYDLLSGAEHTGERSRENMTYVIDKGTELGILVEDYQNLEGNMQKKLLGYMEALKALQDEK